MGRFLALVMTLTLFYGWARANFDEPSVPGNDAPVHATEGGSPMPCPETMTCQPGSSSGGGGGGGW
jgi:hypothetical protein